MSQRRAPGAVKVESIFHPSDFSEASEIAFVDALKIALVTQSRLSMLHVTPGSKLEWQDFPGVRDTLERWKLIQREVPGAWSDSLVLRFAKSLLRTNTR